MNKTCFIDLLIPLFNAKLWKVSSVKGDADTLFVPETLNLVCVKKDVVVFAEDTDIKVMFLHSVNSEMWQITIRSLGNKKAANKSSNIDIKLSASVLNKHIAQYLLVIHAFSGCDTTSATYELGKPSLLKLVSQRIKPS